MFGVSRDVEMRVMPPGRPHVFHQQDTVPIEEHLAFSEAVDEAEVEIARNRFDRESVPEPDGITCPLGSRRERVAATCHERAGTVFPGRVVKSGLSPSCAGVGKAILPLYLSFSRIRQNSAGWSDGAIELAVECREARPCRTFPLPDHR